MIKILILSAIIALTTAIGYLLTLDKKKRAKVYAELYEFNEQLLLNMKYGKVRIESVASRFRYVGDILAGKGVLGGDDEEILRTYSRCVGASDPQSQIDYLNERKSVFKKLHDESAENYKKYSALYVQIALMIGILIAVLLA